MHSIVYDFMLITHIFMHNNNIKIMCSLQLYSVVGESQFTVNGLVFGASISTMGLLILIITVVLTITLIRSRKQASKLVTLI